MNHLPEELDKPTRIGIAVATKAAIIRYPEVVEQGADFETDAHRIALGARSTVATDYNADVPLDVLYRHAIGTLIDIDSVSDDPRPLTTYQ